MSPTDDQGSAALPVGATPTTPSPTSTPSVSARIFAPDPAVAEEVQALGREGVAIVKRWLEATTHMQLSYDVYDFPGECIVPYFDGKKRLDLAGRFMTGSKARIYVECKRYKSVGGQGTEYLEFLRIAYSGTLKDIEHYGYDRKSHYLWVTTHPFSQGEWKNLETHEYMRKALLERPSYLGNSEIDEDRLREVSSRVMVLVFNPKQEDLSLTGAELKLVHTLLERS